MKVIYLSCTSCAASLHIHHNKQHAAAWWPSQSSSVGTKFRQFCQGLQIPLYSINDLSLLTDIIERISIFHGLQQSNIGCTYTCIHVNIFSNVYSHNIISVTWISICMLWNNVRSHGKSSIHLRLFVTL